MTRDEIDDLMREHGIVVVGDAVYSLVQLVIEREREECAKVCELIAINAADHRASECAAAIRARGSKSR